MRGLKSGGGILDSLLKHSIGIKARVSVVVRAGPVPAGPAAARRRLIGRFGRRLDAAQA
jgi:hypothetical protein